MKNLYAITAIDYQIFDNCDINDTYLFILFYFLGPILGLPQGQPRRVLNTDHPEYRPTAAVSRIGQDVRSVPRPSRTHHAESVERARTGQCASQGSCAGSSCQDQHGWCRGRSSRVRGKEGFKIGKLLQENKNRRVIIIIIIILLID